MSPAGAHLMQPVAASGAPAIGAGSHREDPSRTLSGLFLLGRKLGDGAFGVVHSCTRRSDGQELAVKLVDVVVNKPTDVWKEAQMIESLAHPNIVRFHGLFPENTCMCIVMEKLSGGDLVEGLQTHLSKRGNIDGQNIIGAAWQMTSSIQYLHHRLVVHRDVKGDNFLMDRPDIADPACRIVLTDFGAACRLGRPGERLSGVVGTRKFSPPEFFDRNYGVKVDVWALGIVMYGLATGRFPFRNEVDVRTKAIFIPRTVYPPFADFIEIMLRKDEALRLDSDGAMIHPYLNPGCSARQEPVTPAALVRVEQASVEESMRMDTPRFRAVNAHGHGRGKSVDTSGASTAEPLSEADTSPEGSRDADRRSLKFATAQLHAVLANSPAKSGAPLWGPPPAGSRRLAKGGASAGAADAAAPPRCLPRCLLGLGLRLLLGAPRRAAAELP